MIIHLLQLSSGVMPAATTTWNCKEKMLFPRWLGSKQGGPWRKTDRFWKGRKAENIYVEKFKKWVENRFMECDEKIGASKKL